MKKYVFIILFSFSVLIFFFNRGFAYYDEGFILYAAQRFLQGEIPYKDFDFIYTPGTIFLTAAAFKIFGESIRTGRILALVVSILTSYLVYLVCYRATKNSLGSILAVLIYLAWGPTHINFPWPTTFTFSLGLIAAYFLFKKEFFYSGLLIAITLLFKQNFGVAVFLSSVLAIGLIRQKKQLRIFLNYILGFVIGLLIFFIYLFSTNSLNGFFDNFYFYTVKKIILEGVAGSIFPAGVKGLFYLFPGLISLIAVFVAYKRQKNYIILPLFTFFFYLFGIRPTTDYPHLAVLMSSVGIPLTILIPNLKNNKFSSIVLGVMLVFFGFYTALFKNYYRWDSPFYKQKYFMAEPKAKIFVDQKFNHVIPKVISEIKKNTTKNDYIFIFPNAPMFYFLSERKNPTRFINLPPGLHTSAQEREVVDVLRKKRVRLILTNEPLENSKYPVISEFIRKNYLKKKGIFEFRLWEKVENGKRFEVLNR